LNGDNVDFLIFKLNDELFGIELKKTSEVIKYDMDFTRIPGELEWIKGAINLRNNIVPVVDLKERLGLWDRRVHRDDKELEPALTSNGHAMILVAKVDNEAVGFIIDEVKDLHQVSRLQIEEIKNRDLLREGCFSGLALMENNLVKLLNVENI